MTKENENLVQGLQVFVEESEQKTEYLEKSRSLLETVLVREVNLTPELEAEISNYLLETTMFLYKK
jgi:hypothetical protein